MAASRVHSAEFHGLPCTEATLASGDFVRVAHHGAHVLSWRSADGTERLYLSPQAVMDGASPIRGGVPICFPQFNTRALGETALPKHGFARTTAWTLQDTQVGANSATLGFGLQSNAQTLALWPHAFAAQYRVVLTPGQLRMEFAVRNTSEQAWPFALALHTYLRTQDLLQARLTGLQGLQYWDAALHLRESQVRSTAPPEPLAFGAETDHVYEAVHAPLTLQGGASTLRISQSPSMPEAVVWNPAAKLCAALPDMPLDGWQHMLCVEAACINTPVQLAPGAQWSGWQELTVLTT